MSALVPRPTVASRIEAAFSVHPAVTLVGPRQCGKTTLSKLFTRADSDTVYFDLEDEVDCRRLQTPKQNLSRLTGTVVFDEIQRQPELLETFRVMLDGLDYRARFLILGSASPILLNEATESLAGRVGIVNLTGFTLDEVQNWDWQILWFRGGFPRSFLANNDDGSVLWRRNFVRTFLERDIPQLGINVPATTLRRFWLMIAHYHGQVWNAAEFARALGTNEPMARRYLEILNAAYMVRVLAPWHENLKKRQLRSPKIYLRDSGVLHSLLEIDSFEALSGHPKIGASFEGFVIEQILDCLDSDSFYFWGTHGGAELDLLITIGGKRYGIECKFSDAPGTTRSMRTSMADLQLEHLWVIYPGSENYHLDDSISVVSVECIPELIMSLKTKGVYRLSK